MALRLASSDSLRSWLRKRLARSAYDAIRKTCEAAGVHKILRHIENGGGDDPFEARVPPV